MSENWNAWANAEGEDDDVLEAERRRKEEEQKAINWLEAYDLARQEEQESDEEKGADIFASPEGNGLFGKLVETDSEGGDESEGDADTGEAASDNPNETILETPTFREDDPGEQALSQYETEGPDDAASGEGESEVIEGGDSDESAEEDAPVEEIATGVEQEEQVQQPAEADGESEDKPDQATHAEAQAQDQSPEPEPPDTDQQKEEVLKIDRSEQPEEALDTSTESADDTTRQEEALSLDAEVSDGSIEGSVEEDDGARPVEGDRSPVVSEAEAAELQAQFEDSPTPDEAILNNPTFLEDEPDIPEDEKPVAEREPTEEADEAEEDSDSQKRQGFAAGTKRPLVGVNSGDTRSKHKDTETLDQAKSMEKNTEVQAHEEGESELDIPPGESLEDEGHLEEARGPEDEAAEPEDSETRDGDSSPEDLLLYAAAAEAARRNLVANEEGKEKIKAQTETASNINQEFSGQTGEQANQTPEEIEAERINAHRYETDRDDPEAEAFEKRQETIRDPSADNKAVSGHLYGSNQEMTPLSTVISDKERSMAELGLAGSYEDSLASQEISGDSQLNYADTTNHKSAIVMGVITGLLIVLIAGIYFIIR